MNRIDQRFRENPSGMLSVFYTAGYPERDSTTKILNHLQHAGVDMVEIGIPFSDPVADGPVIQQSSQQSLKNGMSLEILFKQLENIRKNIRIPLLLMGYLNPVYRFGMERFCSKCADTGIDGVIIPDLPLEEYVEHYAEIFGRFGLYNIFLISPTSDEQRVRKLEKYGRGFLYLVSTSSTTGVARGTVQSKDAYYRRILNMKLRLPTMIGFGISSSESFRHACRYASGAIVGSAFLRVLANAVPGDPGTAIHEFIEDLRSGQNG